jgi:polysaccharide export outer membrane protein
MKILPFLAMCSLLFVACAGAAKAADADYTLSPGDLLQVTVWGDAKLDRPTLVLPDGSISFPLVDSIMVRGLTVTQVADKIRAILAQRKEIDNASVTVVVTSAFGNVVDVLGQVNKPGELQAGHRMTVMQALSLAGGLTPFAAEHRISILRHRDDGSEYSIRFHTYDALLDGKKLDTDIPLQPGDVIVVPAASLF